MQKMTTLRIKQYDKCKIKILFLQQKKFKGKEFPKPLIFLIIPLLLR